MEQSAIDLLKEVPVLFWDEGKPDTFRDAPGIIVTFHTGSFRLIGHYLAANGIPFKLVVANDGMLREGNLANELYSQESLDTIGFDLIDANEKNCLIKICRTLREKTNVLIYMDGNTGAGNEYQNQNLITVPFLNQHINVRAGAAYAAFINKVPLYPVTASRRWRYVSKLEFRRPIIPNSPSDKKTFAESVMVSIYKDLENLVYERPWQWDGWLYLHHYAKVSVDESIHPQIDNDGKSAKKQVAFNKRDYGFFRVNEKHFLFRKADYKCFEVEQWLYTRLEQLYEGSYRFTVPMLNRNHMADLVKSRVVVQH